LERRFASKTDPKLAVAAMGLPLLLAGVLVLNSMREGSAAGWIAVPLIAMAALLAWFMLDTWYGFEGGTLHVHSGPCCWRIPLEQIFDVCDSSSLRSGPALSLDRLEIRFGDDRRILVSPRDKGAFLQTLRAQAPGLQRAASTGTPRT
jgi:hypothetical protein